MERKWSELRLWNGGICPVGPDDLVWVLFDDMENRSGFARDYHWSRADFAALNIIAYRVEVKPAPLIERWANVYTRDDGELVVGLLFKTESLALAAANTGASQILLREVRE